MDMLTIVFKAGILSALTVAIYNLFLKMRYNNKYSVSAESKTRIADNIFIQVIISLTAFAPLVLKAQGDSGALKYLPVAVCLIFTCIVDMKWNKIPNEIVASIIVYWFIVSIYICINEDSFNFILKALVGGGVIFAILYALIVFAEGSVGSGDAKLMFAVGAVCGGILSLYFFMLTFILAAVGAIIFLLLKKIDKRTKIPMAPFITFAFVITIYLNTYLEAINIY